MQAEESLKPQRHLFNSKPFWGSSVFLMWLCKDFKWLLPSTFFIHCTFLHSFAAHWFRDLLFSLDTDKQGSKRGFTAKQSQAKRPNLCRVALCFITPGRPRHHSQTWGTIMACNKCSKWLNFIFKPPHRKMWWCRINILHWFVIFKVKTTSQLVLLITFFFFFNLYFSHVHLELVILSPQGLKVKHLLKPYGHCFLYLWLRRKVLW